MPSTFQQQPSTDAWEDAYLRFETREEEIRKFTARLRRFGATAWPKTLRVVELFCGRGNGLHAWERLGFTNLTGVDLSSTLLSRYSGSASCIVADCRNLPLTSGSKDVAVVQGGLHHLPVFPSDLDKTLAEIRRVLAPEGRVLFVEPWLTPFLEVVHIAIKSYIARRLWGKLDALAVMTENEEQTYRQWLEQPQVIRAIALRHFVTLHESFRWGKWYFLGKPNAELSSSPFSNLNRSVLNQSLLL